MLTSRWGSDYFKWKFYSVMWAIFSDDEHQPCNGPLFQIGWVNERSDSIITLICEENKYILKNNTHLFIRCGVLFFLHLFLALPARIWTGGDLAPGPLPLLAPREGPLADHADLGLLHLTPIEDAEGLRLGATHCTATSCVWQGPIYVKDENLNCVLLLTWFLLHSMTKQHEEREHSKDSVMREYSNF